MRAAPLTLFVVLLLGGGAALWLLRGESRPGAPAPTPVAGAQAETRPAPEPAADSTRREIQSKPAEAAAPPAPAPAPAAQPAGPLPGANVIAISGGAEAFAEFYRTIDTDGRRSRLDELEAALAEYSGDPTDRAEFEKYQALKDEAAWLRAHPDL